MLAAVAADGDDPSARYGSKHAMAACAALDTSAVFRLMPTRPINPAPQADNGSTGRQGASSPTANYPKTLKRRSYEVRSGLSHHRTISHVPITKLESEKAMKVTCGGRAQPTTSFRRGWLSVGWRTARRPTNRALLKQRGVTLSYAWQRNQSRSGKFILACCPQTVGSN